MSAYITGFAYQQVWEAPDLHPDRKGRADRSEPDGADTSNFQAIRWSHGPIAT